ncbi:MAG: VWA domain-containing protein, partial [Gammaproteobacteria bacterium]|nr:VWA domain-containing protein [Gammaproteobacteria bacterium]
MSKTGNPMPTYHTYNRYSEWDGTQAFLRPDADAILSAISDDLMEFGDLQQALRYLARNGMQRSDEGYIKGLRDMLRQLREKKQQQLNRYDMGSVMEDIKRQLEEILQMEQDTIDEWVNRDSSESADTAEDDATGAAAEDSGDFKGDSLEAGSQFSDRVLGDIGKQNQQFLDALPKDAAGQVRALQNYEFLNPDAQRKFLKLIEQLKKAMTQSLFKDIENMVQQMSAGDLQKMKEMVRDLNEMLVKKIAGEDPGFEEFMEKHGDMFGDNPPRSLDELLEMMQQQMAATQSMLNSMSIEQRQQLESLLTDKFGDPELESELAKLAKEMAFLNPQGNRYNFRGDEELDLQAAMKLMGEMQEMDDLERQIQQAQFDGEVDSIDPDKLEELLGEDARRDLEEINKFLKTLEDAGYVRRDGEKWELTPRGTRNLGQKALAEIYARLKKQNLGNHAVPEEGRFGERMEDTKAYEFGDPFNLHMSRTIRNALDRNGPQTPVKLHIDDFEIYRSEVITETATVLMVDLSW